MKVVKSLKVLTASLAVVALGAGSAFASVHIGGSGNETTGPHSDNNNSWDIHQDSDISVLNSADANNDYSVWAGTGDNLFGHNTELGDVWTGDVSGDISFDNALNDAAISFMGPNDLGNVSIDLSNYLTGPYSDNHNDVDISHNSDIHITNTADINNDIHYKADTGHNGVNCNTVAGDVTTGDVRISASVDNQANTGSMIDLSNLVSSADISADMSNSLTGPDSRNINDLDVRASSDVHIVNKADINNDFSADVNTGNNSIAGNTVVGNVRTGDVNLDFQAVNQAN